MVNCGIVGLGHVGSTLAFALLKVPQVTIIGAIDSNLQKQAGELEDLEQALMMLGIEDRIITPDVSHADMLFICAGNPRMHIGNNFETDEKLYERNLPILESILEEASQTIPREKIYIVTNPSTKFAKHFGCHGVGETLASLRAYSNSKSGAWILKNKGFTNFGVVAECLEIISDYILQHERSGTPA